MSNSAPFIQPHLLTAAALAWNVFHRAEQSNRNDKHDDEYADDFALDSIPEMIHHHSSPSFQQHNKYETPKRRVVPVMIPSSEDSDSTTSSTRPKIARVSAATMRNLQSRRRVRSSMNHYKQKTTTTTSPQEPTKPEEEPTTVIHSVTPSSPPSDIHCTPSEEEPLLIRFKVKSSDSNTLIRFQCEPCFDAVQKNIETRMRITSFIIQFQDDDGDMCIMSNNEDLQDAIAAATDETLVRLQVEEEAKGLFHTIALKFGW